jgi:hypothetical protein
MIDVVCLAVVGVVVWCVASEGLWGAAQTVLVVILSGLLAMNFFEPVAGFLDGLLGGYKGYSDILSLTGLFTAAVFALRLGSEQLSPTFIQLPSTVDQFGRWGFAALAGYVTMAFLLTAVHTAPFPREFMGFKPERANFFGMAPDRQWLGFTQYVTEKSFGHTIGQDRVTKELVSNGFDGKYELLGDPNLPFPNTIWPSFPIKYAMRRSQLSGSAAAPTPVAVPVTAPSGNASPGGNPGF